MAETLDMTLDDIIKNNKKANSSSGGGGGRGGRREGRRGSAAGGGGSGGGGSGGGVGPTRRPFKRSGNRAEPYQPPKAPESAWQHDMYSDVAAGGGGGGGSGGGGRVSAIETGTKLYISNLDFGVSTEDIKELFSELGDLKRYVIHYDRSGRSKGTAEVVFARRGDAVAAVKKYNNVQLDGKPMKIEILGTNTPTSAAALPANNGGYVRNIAKSAPRGGPAGLQQGRHRPRGGGRRRGGGGGGGGGGGSGGSGGRRGKERNQPKSAEELDADLEKWLMWEIWYDVEF
uniref:RRM domain-containing protein n=1 Tax=Leersia perrieri TaxID=77586 RepID=A0A0D9VSJ4_9ORYZ